MGDWDEVRILLLVGRWVVLESEQGSRQEEKEEVGLLVHHLTRHVETGACRSAFNFSSTEYGKLLCLFESLGQNHAPVTIPRAKTQICLTTEEKTEVQARNLLPFAVLLLVSSNADTHPGPGSQLVGVDPLRPLGMDFVM